MGILQPTERKVVLFPSTQTAVGPATVADTKPLNVTLYNQAIFILSVTAQAGTTPTLDVYIQQEIPIAGATDTWGQVPSGAPLWDDLCHFTQVTTATGTWLTYAVAGANTANILKDAALAAATVRNGPIGSNLRIKYVTAGTTPQYTFSVTAILW
jgi:hypothetical protein